MDFLDEIAAAAGDRPAGPEPHHRPKRDGLFYGRAIYKGRLQFFSVSSLSLGDPESTGGCPRRWWFEKVGGRGRPGQGAANVLGEQLHEENATYLKTGDRSHMGPLALAGLHTLQPPGPDLGVEHEIASGTPGKLVSKLTCVGLPVVGKIDLWHRRGTCAGTTDINEIRDPAGTTEVQDHKTTSDLKWALTRDELPDTVQMSGYGVWAINDHGADPVRLSHGYYVTKGRPRAEKRSILVPAERLLRRWEYVEGRGRVLVDITQETDPNKVDFNVKACDFPRRRKVDRDAGIADGCPHLKYCDGAKQHAINNLYGEAKETDDMGFLDELNSDAPTVDAELDAALAHIRHHGNERGLGFPSLGGEPARAQARLSGVALDSDALAGAGRLGKLVLTARADVLKLAGELGWPGRTAFDPQTERPVDEQSTLVAAADDKRPPPQLATPEAQASAEYRDAKAAVEKAEAEASAKLDAAAAKALRTRKKADAPATTATPAPQQPAFPGVLILIDAIPSFPATNLRHLAQQWADKAAASASVRDIRSNAVERDNPCAYGGWRGVYFTIARAELAALPADVYYLDSRDGDFAEIVVDAAMSTPGLAVARGVS